MNIYIITPSGAAARTGNRVTARRWARILRTLGHRVTVGQEYHSQPCDLLVALHARRSFPSVKRYRRERPENPLVVALPGTDLYRDIHSHISAQQSLEMATRLIVLQPMGLEELPGPVRHKTRVIYQSAKRPPGEFAPTQNAVEVCVMGHLRPVKDPFRAAMAVRLLPETSRIRVVHLGAAMTPKMAAHARAEMAKNPRYRWLGNLPRWKALRRLARSRVLVLSSKMEGGANVVSEAIASSVPVISSRILGSLGLLGRDYAGYYPVGDTRALARLLGRVEADPDFYQCLKEWCGGLKPLVDPARERQSWKDLLQELVGH